METIQSEFLPHFSGLANGKIELPYCPSCKRFHWYPMPRCPHCRSGRVEWKSVSGSAKLYSWTVVRHAFQPALKSELPYVVALVTFDDAPGVRFVTNLVQVENVRLHCGMPLKPVFETPPNGRPKVKFRPGETSCEVSETVDGRSNAV